MDIAVHDFAGHPFQVQLSRQLARNGHRVHHLYCDAIIGPRGLVADCDGDPASLTIEALATGSSVAKENFLRRFWDEYRYGRLAAERIAAIHPDVVLCSNTPLDALRLIQHHCRARGIKVVNWLQDVNSLAIADILPGRIPVVGSFVASHYLAMERRLLRHADQVIAIAVDFRDFLLDIGLVPSRLAVIENWAPLEEMPRRPRNNAWSKRYGLDDGRCAIYSGNLGFKQNPAYLIDLARAMGEAAPGDRLVVVSEGIGARWLAEQQAALRLPNLLLLPFQPYAEVGDMMGAADVLLGLLEPQARPFCVPSKILSYCCAGRPIVLAADPGNLASRIISGHDCGAAVAAGDSAAFTDAVLALLAHEPRRSACGERARRYAEKTFEIGPIAARFEAVLENVVARP